MRFLLDENFPKAARSLLEELDHESLDFRTSGEEGAQDSKVIQMAIREEAVVLTTDRDFFHTLGRQHPSHFGVVVIALKQPTRESILDRLKWFLERFAETDIPGRSFQLRDRVWLAYPPLDDD